MTNDGQRVNSFFALMIVKERMARGTQQVDARGRSAAFLEIAEGLGLGGAAREKIEIADVKLR
jgi:hypothetical protein